MNITLVQTPDDADDFRRWMMTESSGWVAVDTETTGLDPWKDELRLVSFGGVDAAYVLPYPEQEKVIGWALNLGLPMVAHNAKFDYQFLTRAGFNGASIVDDTQIMAHLINSARTMSLKGLAEAMVDPSAAVYQKDLRRMMKENRWTWATVPATCFEYWYYAGMDTILTARLARLMYGQVQSRYADLYNMETDVWLALAKAEKLGLALDVSYCYDQLVGLEEKIIDIVERYPDLNLGSPVQIKKALADQRIIVADTSIARLEGMRGIPIVDDILEFRRLNKLAGTYFGPFLELVVDGRIHTTINPLGARTGRMSSERPNLQNVPKREAGSFVRQAFIASPGHSLVLADYAQIEYRIFASYAGEEEMIKAFLDGKDMHAVTAEMALGHPPNAKERLIAKNGNFAELYMAGLDKFARTAGISIEQAKSFRSAYHTAFPKIKPFTQAVMRYAQQNGWAVETKFGRRIPVEPERLYAGINYMIQGGAADVLKRAIVRIAETPWIQYFALPVHDELIFDVPDDVAPDLMVELPGLMEDLTTFAVPLTVEVTRQRKWGVDG